jgi:hypothetical protein
MLARRIGALVGISMLVGALGACSYFVSDVKGYDSTESFTAALSAGGVTCEGGPPAFTKQVDATDPTFTYFEAPCSGMTLTYYPDGHPISRDRCARPDSQDAIVAGLNWTVTGAQGDQAQSLADAAKGEVMTVGQFDRQVCKNLPS